MEKVIKCKVMARDNRPKLIGPSILFQKVVVKFLLKIQYKDDPGPICILILYGQTLL